MSDDDIYIRPDGGLQLGKPESTEFKAPKGAPVSGYVSPLWPPPGDPRVAHHCERGEPCRCVPVESTWNGIPIATDTRLPPNVIVFRRRD